LNGYSRQSIFDTDDLILALDHNNEYNKLEIAFHREIGHAHNGAAGEGPVIALIGDAGQIAPINRIEINTVDNSIDFYINEDGDPVNVFNVTNTAILPGPGVTYNFGDEDNVFNSFFLNQAYFPTLVASPIEVENFNTIYFTEDGDENVSFYVNINGTPVKIADEDGVVSPTVGNVAELTISGSTVTVDLSSGANYFNWDNTAAHTVVLINKPGDAKVGTFFFKITNADAFDISFVQPESSEGITCYAPSDNEFAWSSGIDTVICTVYGASGIALIDTRMDWVEL
jgi:hypothetical protein